MFSKISVLFYFLTFILTNNLIKGMDRYRFPNTGGMSKKHGPIRTGTATSGEKKSCCTIM
ncbi:hypothetical protein PGT21_021104 [Puccinia graminis f. sp. tritici]|uniref:Uncharacterized protein n=1 Tax=Puccinia graminis f. sp. tritici TaxID=56615 RepID=A0A5B0PPD1_PUCGR|nr:hypothetical protein PGT21_021104 [Puccinia graminis f. sp. tritici]KAA1112344.1 hypothetical protein PGTUg99_018885 [Puccinia graminis f. sp. tritici]